MSSSDTTPYLFAETGTSASGHQLWYPLKWFAAPLLAASMAGAGTLPSLGTGARVGNRETVIALQAPYLDVGTVSARLLDSDQLVEPSAPDYGVTIRDLQH
ncbi:MAG: hypothetical protein ACRDX8_13005, partial [Acidimicrobiales bacterium]